MALHFLVEDLAADAGAGDDVEITGTEAHHAAVVRRVRAVADGHRLADARARGSRAR